MAFQLYPNFKVHALEGDIGDLESVAVKFLLLDDGHADSDAYDVLADVQADEVSGSGYTAGGIASPAITVVDNAGVSEVRLASDPVFTAITVTNAKTVVAYVDGATKYLIGRHVEGTAQSPAGIDLPVNFTGANNLLFSWD